MSEQLKMCAFPAHSKKVETVLTDRVYWVKQGRQSWDFDSLPAAWDHARLRAQRNPDPEEAPTIWAEFLESTEWVLYADWANTY